MLDDQSQTRRRFALAGLSTTMVAALCVTLGAIAAAPAAAATTTDTLGVDLSHTTGAFRGGSTGTLYGLGDDGVPSQAVLDGARITNTSQKPPQGAQHPNGDALDVEKNFFASGGKDLYVYVQDEYPDWAYNGGKRPGDANNDGEWDYLPILRAAVEKVATQSTHPEDYIFIPFNEPDAGNWYPNWSTQKTQFLADWTAAYNTIEAVYQTHGLGHAKIGGPGDSSWHADRSTDLLTYAKAHDELPDVFIWHELGTNNLATFRSNVTAYRQILANLGISDIPVNTTEFGMLRDMGVPGQLVQWLSMFEDEKVDAQTAYWNYAGNLSDNSSRNNGANGGWWMFKWYGDLQGSSTVAVTPPQLNTPDTLQAIGAVDPANKKATVLLGGGTHDVAVNVKGIDTSVFGSSVDVTVRADRLNGAEGASLQPPVVVSSRIAVKNGAISVTVPNNDRYSAYQVEITPSLAARQSVATDLVSSVEAENTTLANATAYTQDPSREWSFMASGGKDVGSFNKAGSSATWNVTVPRTGTYRLSVLAGANLAPGQHALFVDGTYSQLIKYSADLSWTYRGTTDVTVALTAGTHALSIRASKDGSTVLPGADITLDRFDLYDVTDGEKAVYPALDARLGSGATLSYAQPTAGSAALSGAATATFFEATAETGYYDITTRFTTTAVSTPSLTVNGRAVTLPGATGAGSWASVARVYLPQGVNELTVTAADGALVQDVTTLRGSAQKAAEADTANVVRSEAETLPRSGTAVVQTVGAGSNGSADASGVVKDVGYLGNGAGNTLTVPRPAGFAPGAYQLVLGATNADKASAINYNPQVISRFIDVTEAGGQSVRASVRHNYSWVSFWDKTVPLTLTTTSGALTLGNATAYAPNIDTVTLAKFVAGTPVTARTTVALAVNAKAQCINGTADIAVYALNNAGLNADIRLTTPAGDKKFTAVAAGNAAYNLFDSGQRSIAAGTATIAGYTWTDGFGGAYSTYQASYGAVDCG
ncbi:CBM35 domain-containing protein [Leifsonia sp. LS-T14]|uniref:CBM35 domain-containing protein n=1 Tax=unclassified Leifsonia TaxID=2663824 RepID=UPI0035A59B68